VQDSALWRLAIFLSSGHGASMTESVETLGHKYQRQETSRVTGYRKRNAAHNTILQRGCTGLKEYRKTYRCGAPAIRRVFPLPRSGQMQISPLFWPRIFPSESHEIPRLAPSTFSSTISSCRKNSSRSDSDKTLSPLMSTPGRVARCGVEGYLKKFSFTSPSFRHICLQHTRDKGNVQ